MVLRIVYLQKMYGSIQNNVEPKSSGSFGEFQDIVLHIEVTLSNANQSALNIILLFSIKDLLRPEAKV